jgi:protein-tyrosine phosphatase
MLNEEELPRNFRTTQDPFKFFSQHPPSSEGLAKLNASGSAQFSENSLKAIKSKIPFKKIMIVDLRQESHGFINGNAVSWYGVHNWANRSKSLSEIEQDEEERLLKALNQPFLFIYYQRRFPIPISAHKTATESEVTEALNLAYVRIPTLDHSRPTDECVDQFINLIKNLPKDTWLHFHCAAGQGRTTTFLALYDMMHNASHLSFENIVERQHLLGGAKLLAFETEPQWKQETFTKRALFLKQFYDYCLHDPLFNQSWINYRSSHSIID